MFMPNYAVIIKDAPSDCRWEIKERPKTYAGYRDLMLPPEIMEKVRKAGILPYKEMGGWNDIGTLTKTDQYTMESKRADVHNKINPYYAAAAKYDTK